MAIVLLALEQPTVGFGIHFALTLGSKRGHMLVTPAVNLMSVGIHCEDQHHGAAQDPSSHRTHGGTLDHV